MWFVDCFIDKLDHILGSVTMWFFFYKAVKICVTMMTSQYTTLKPEYIFIVKLFFLIFVAT